MYHHQYCSIIKMGDLNPHLMCVLCGGYFIDATTIIECLHSFCRTCIVRYLESSKFCPICDVQVHKTRPLLNIRSDKTLQDLVYKLVPDLFDEEMRRRREFLSQHPEVRRDGMDLETRGQAKLVPVHSLPDQRISLVLQLARPRSLSPHPAHRHKARSPASKKTVDRRYLLCPSEVNIGHLKKFLRLKFNMPEKYQINVFHKQEEETISDDFTLLDITFIYSWNRKKPLRLYYSVYEKPRLKRKLVASRLLTYQPTPAKVFRPDSTDPTTHMFTHPLYKPPAMFTPTPVPASHPAVDPGMCKSLTKGRPLPKKPRTIPDSQSYKRAKQTVKKVKKDFLKKQLGNKMTAKRKKSSFDSVQRGNRGLKQKTKKRGDSVSSISRNSSGSIIKHRRKSGDTRPDARRRPSSEKGVTKLTRRAADSHPVTAQSSRPTPDDRKRPASPAVQTSLETKTASSVSALSNGVVRASLARGSHLKRSGSRSASPRPSTPSSSRSASPKLTGAGSKSNGSGGSSPKQTNTKGESRTALNGTSAKLGNWKEGGSRPATSRQLANGRDYPKVSGRDRDSPRPASRGSSRTDSPRPLAADLQHAMPVFPSVPVEEKITIDVTMTTSASETSSDVTSPGAEDRANSAGLEEPGYFDSGGHLCNVAAFAPRSLPALVPLPGNGQRQGKGNQAKEAAKPARPPQAHAKPPGRAANNRRR